MADDNKKQDTDDQKQEEPKKEEAKPEVGEKTDEKPVGADKKEEKTSEPAKPFGPSETKEETKPEEPEKKPIEAKKEAPKPKKEVKVSGKLKKIIEEVEKLTVLELADLVKALEDRFGVAAAPVAAPTAGPAQAQPSQATGSSPEQTIFNVILTQTGANKIQVIKALRQIKTDLGLQEAKKMTEEAPQEILSQVKKKEAEEAKKKLEEAGATVELK